MDIRIIVLEYARKKIGRVKLVNNIRCLVIPKTRIMMINKEKFRLLALKEFKYRRSLDQECVFKIKE